MADTVELQVHIARDAETGRWYIANSEVPGLWLEADSASALIDKIEAAAPELIELNSEEITRMHKIAGSAAHRILPVFDSALDLPIAC